MDVVYFVNGDSTVISLPNYINLVKDSSFALSSVFCKVLMLYKAL